ncbi:hypothetical protein VaNZ11_002278, partial [Volvox africanus]
MPGPPPAPAGLHSALSAAMSAAARDAVSRHALHHGPPYSKQLQQPFPLSRTRSSGAVLVPAPASTNPSSEDPANSTYPGSPWTPPPTNSDGVDLLIGQPPLDWDTDNPQGYRGPLSGSDVSDNEGNGAEEEMGTDGIEGNVMAGSSSGGGSGDGATAGEKQSEADVHSNADGTDADANVEGDPEGADDGRSWSSRYFSRDPTLEGVIADGSPAGDAGNGGGVVIPVARGQPAVEDAEVLDAEDNLYMEAEGPGALPYLPTGPVDPQVIPSKLPQQPLPSAGAAAVRDGAAAPAIRGPAGGNGIDLGRASAATAGLAGGAAAGPSPDTVVAIGHGSGVSGVITNVKHSMSGGVTGIAILPHANIPGGYSGTNPSPATGARPSRPSWAGSHDSDPPSTSGSAYGAASTGLLGTTSGGRSGGGGVSGRRALASTAERSFQGGGIAASSSSRPQSMVDLELGLVGSGVVTTGSGQAPGVQSGFFSPDRPAPLKIQIEVSAASRLELKVRGRGRPATTTAAMPPPPASSRPLRRGRPTAAATTANSATTATANNGTSVSFDQPDGSSSTSSLASGTAVDAASRSFQSSALWSSARRLRISLHRLHQQYQNYHALQGGQDPGPLDASASLAAVARLRISGHGHEAAAAPGGTGGAPMSAPEDTVADVGGGVSLEHGRVHQRSVSAPSCRPQLGMSGLRMQTDTHLQLDSESSRGLIPSTELDKTLEVGWSDLLQHTDDDGAIQPPHAARSLPVSPRLAKGRAAVGSPRRTRSAGGGAAEEALTNRHRSASTGLSPTASPLTAAVASGSAVTAASAAATKSSRSSSRVGRQSLAHPVLIMPSMAATSAAEDPDFVQVVEKARRRAAVEKQKLRAAREVAAGDGNNNKGSMRRRGGTSAPRTASEKVRAAELLFQRQAEEWARTHRQLPPRRRLAPSVTRMVEKWFSLVDYDGSGHLETKELALALQAAGVPCSESDVVELVSTIDVNRDGAVSLTEFLSFLLKELGAGKNLTTGDYLLPSGGQLPFAAMIARLKRLRVLDDVMKGGKARNRYVDMLYNRDALAAEIGLSEEVAAGLQARAVPLESSNGEDFSETASAGGGGRRGGRVRLQQLFQQYRQAHQHATSDGAEFTGPGPAAAPEACDRDFDWEGARKEDGRQLGGERSEVCFAGVDGEEFGDVNITMRDPAPAAVIAAEAEAAAAGAEGEGEGGSHECDSEYDAVAAGFGEKVSGVSYYPRYSREVSVLQGACSSQRASNDGVVVLAPAPIPVVDQPMFFKLTEVLLPVAESSAISERLGSEVCGGGGEASSFSAAAAKAVEVATATTPQRLLLPVISPLPPVKRPNTRAFKRALLDVRHSAPEYLMQRLGLAGPLEAAAAAAATAGSMSPTSDRPRGRRRTGGDNGGGAAAAGRATASFRPLASTSPDGLVAGGEFSATSVSALTSASDPVTASAAASKAAAAAAGAYFTTYGAGFTRYKRWSMYDIDPASENPDYWQAKAAALLMRRTSRAVRGVPGAGVATMSAAAAAAVAAIAAADAAKDIELYPAVPVAAATAVMVEGTEQSNNNSGKQLPPAASLLRRHHNPSQSSQSDGAAVGWHLPSLQTGLTAGGAAAAPHITLQQPGATAPLAAATPAAAAPAASVASHVSALVPCPASPWRRTADEPASPGSPTRRKARSGPHGRGLGACALGRGSAAAAMLSPRAAPPATAASAAAAAGSGAGNSPIQYVIRHQQGANPRLAAEALRRRPVPSAVADGDPLMQRLLSKSASRSPQRSPSRSPQRS